MLLSVTDDDALWLEQEKMQVAEQYAAAVRRAVLQEKKDSSLQSILIRVAWLLLIIVVFSVIVYGINRLFKRLRRKIVREKDRYFKGVKVKEYALLNQQKQIGIVFNILRIARIILILLVFYITLPFVFSIFPWTKGMPISLSTGRFRRLKPSSWIFTLSAQITHHHRDLFYHAVPGEAGQLPGRRNRYGQPYAERILPRLGPAYGQRH